MMIVEPINGPIQMQEGLKSLAAQVESDQLQTHDEIRREFLNIIEEYLEEEFGVIGNIKLERDIGSGFYDAAVGNLEFEIKTPEEGFQAGIDDSQDYVDGISDAPNFFTTEGIHGAHIDPNGNTVARNDLSQLASRLESLLNNAVSKPTPEDIVHAFGPQSERVQSYIKEIWEILQEHRDLERVDNAFETWRDIYAEAANLSSNSRDAVQNQASRYDIDIDGTEETYEFLFAVQTYFAIFLKLFAARLVGEYSTVEGRLKAVAWPESYRRLSVEANIVDHDLFDWILEPARESGDASHQLEDIVTRLASSIDFIDTDVIDQDVLRDLYHGSFDSSTRTAMGEFYTNDELVDEVLDEMNYEGASILQDSTLLDPTCGSGTFLFHAIRRYVAAAEDEGWTDSEIVNGVVDNINGIDLHPFAVAMARTNYLLALGDRAQYLDSVSVYWTDSLATTAQQTLNGQKVTVSTLGSVNVPDPDDIGHRDLFNAMEEAIEGGWSKNRFVGEFDERDRQQYEKTLGGVYDFFTEEIHNGMWIPAFRDTAAVHELKEECEFLVGNPPWVRRKNVEENLRERLQDDFKYYDDPWRPDLEKMRNPPSPRDYAIVFVEAGFDFLNEGGELGFVITSSLARAMYAGKARQALTNNKNLKSVIDYTLSPHDFFPDAENKPLIVTAANEDPAGTTSVCLYNRENETRTWETPASDLSLIDNDPRSPWVLVPPDVLSGIRSMTGTGSRAGDRYTPTRGVQTAANDVFFVNRIDPSDDDDEVVVETDAGDITRIEKNAVRPLVRGRNIDEWGFDVSGFILWPHDDDGNVLQSLPEKLGDYFENHEERLESRSDYMVKSLMDDGYPYWIIGNVTTNDLNDKTAWQDIEKTVEATYLPDSLDLDIESGADLGTQKLITNSKVYYFATDGTDTAKALTGALNSTPVRVYVGSYALRTGGRYLQHKAWSVGIAPIPNEVFSGTVDRITDLVDDLHANGRDEDLSDELDEEIADLYDLSESEIDAMNDFLEFFVA